MATPTVSLFQDADGVWWAFSINPDGSASTEVVPKPGEFPLAVTLQFFMDSTGQWWAFSINPDGSATTQMVSGPTPGPSPLLLTHANSTITLLDTMEWANKFMANRASAIGNFLEPALTSANIIMQTMISAPFRWRWNRTITGFVTTPGQQDYYLFNWEPATFVNTGTVTVDTNGNSQRCTVAGTTGLNMPTWATMEGGNTTDGSGAFPVTWNNQGSIGNASVASSYTFGWIETASVQDTSEDWYEMEQKICLAADSEESRPRFISAQVDDGTGNIAFRLMPIPDMAYPVAITVQQDAPLFTMTSQTWEPIPDGFSNIYSWGFLSLMLLFADDARFQLANQKFVTSLLARNQGLDQTEINIFLNNWQEITGQPVIKANMLSQGIQARGT